ncbi:MAG TPA: riboflavin synthase [Longimicrobiales bacterium]|nr:riboflavin synthase [Longimicrobiales bacterium]
MFTGIVEAVGLVRGVEDRETTRRFRVESALAAGLAPGDSVSVDGACLTVVEASEGSFAVDVIGTTLARTVAGGYREGSRVNLERALKLGDGLDGHLVQGHVDGVGELVRCTKEGEFWIMDFRIPEDVAATTVPRGSICLNGVSLTVSDLPQADVVRVGVIPFTHAHTNLGGLAPGGPVNVEGDLIGKYVGKVLAERAPGART